MSEEKMSTELKFKIMYDADILGERKYTQINKLIKEHYFYPAKFNGRIGKYYEILIRAYSIKYGELYKGERFIDDDLIFDSLPTIIGTRTIDWDEMKEQMASILDNWIKQWENHT